MIQHPLPLKFDISIEPTELAKPGLGFDLDSGRVLQSTAFKNSSESPPKTVQPQIGLKIDYSEELASRENNLAAGAYAAVRGGFLAARFDGALRTSLLSRDKMSSRTVGVRYKAYRYVGAKELNDAQNPEYRSDLIGAAEPEKFRRTYGSHYVAAVHYAHVVEFEVAYTWKTIEKADSFSSHVEASYKTAGANASLALDYLKATSTSSADVAVSITINVKGGVKSVIFPLKEVPEPPMVSPDGKPLVVPDAQIPYTPEGIPALAGTIMAALEAADWKDNPSPVGLTLAPYPARPAFTFDNFAIRAAQIVRLGLVFAEADELFFRVRRLKQGSISAAQSSLASALLTALEQKREAIYNKAMMLIAQQELTQKEGKDGKLELTRLIRFSVPAAAARVLAAANIPTIPQIAADQKDIELDEDSLTIRQVSPYLPKRGLSDPPSRLELTFEPTSRVAFEQNMQVRASIDFDGANHIELILSAHGFGGPVTVSGPTSTIGNVPPDFDYVNLTFRTEVGGSWPGDVPGTSVMPARTPLLVWKIPRSSFLMIMNNVLELDELKKENLKLPKGWDVDTYSTPYTAIFMIDWKVNGASPSGRTYLGLRELR